MKKFTGDLNVFLEALGKKQGDNAILKAITIIAMDFDIENFEYDDVSHTYFHFFKHGVEFVFTERNKISILESIFFYINKVDRYNDYPFSKELITNLEYPFDRASIIETFGEPEKISEKWIRYFIGDKYIHFEFNNDNVSLITLFIDT